MTGLSHAKLNVGRILIVKWSAMGDVALASAIFEDVALAYPEAEIDLNTLPPCATLFAEDPRFAHLYTFNVRAKRGSWKAMYAWLKTMRERRYDLIIDLQTTDRSRMLIGLLTLIGGGGAVRLGNNPGFPYTASAQIDTNVPHALERMRATIAAGGIGAQTERPVLHAGPVAIERADALRQSHHLEANHFAVFLPGSQAGGYLKRWGVDRYADLAKRLLAGELRHVVLLGGPDEVDACEAIAKRVGPGLVNLCGATQLLDIAPFCADARFIVANDTGTAHLAAAANRPMLVICGPTDPRRVRPAGPHVTTMQADLACINCYRKHCGHHSCMRLITPSLVVDHLQRDAVLGIQTGTIEESSAGRRASDG